jgi:hypothetical protein
VSAQRNQQRAAAVAVAAHGAAALPSPCGEGSARRLVIANGTLEALKWSALFLMTIDHVNKYLLNWSETWMFAVGRMAMPIFAIVLAYNLARPEAMTSGAYQRMMRHLAMGAAISTIPFVALGKVQFAGGWLPLNVLATLLVATAVMYLAELGGARRIALAAAVFIVGGALVEFWWFGVALAVAAHAYLRKPSFGRLSVVIGVTTALALVNGNFWALGGLAIVAASTRVRLDVPRVRWFFYAYYPAHLAALWAVHGLLPEL